MILHSVMVTYDRLDCTKKALESYLETVSVPYALVVVDNGSQKDTEDWLVEQWDEGLVDDLILLGENKYPGFACNRGWEKASDAVSFLHRADNDWSFYPDWCYHLQQAFADPKVGQVGLRTGKEESRNGIPIPWNVGGNCVIRRDLWDQGLRYDERPWTELPAGHSEDTYLSPAVEKMGYKWTRVAKPCIYGVSDQTNAMNEDYYRRSWGARRIYGLKPWPEDLK